MKRCSQLMLVVAVLSLCTITAFAGTQKASGKEAHALGATNSGTPQAGVLATDIFVEGFNDTLVFPPAGWLMINADHNVDPEDTAWYVSTTVGGTGGPGPQEGLAFAADYYGTANGFYIDDYLVTPNTGGTAPVGSTDSLTFWIAARLSSSGNYPDSLDIRVSTTGRAVADFTTRLGYVLAPKALWKRFAYALPITANRYIAFRYLMYDGGPNGANSDKVCLDNVRISRYGSTSVSPKSGTPQQFQLNQNYPNPFNPTTRIEFTITTAANTQLKVYNLIGQEVATLVNEELQPGTYAADFSGAGLPSGIYLYKLTAGTFSATRHMTLIK